MRSCGSILLLLTVLLLPGEELCAWRGKCAHWTATDMILVKIIMVMVMVVVGIVIVMIMIIIIIIITNHQHHHHHHQRHPRPPSSNAIFIQESSKTELSKTPESSAPRVALSAAAQQGRNMPCLQAAASCATQKTNAPREPRLLPPPNGERGINRLHLRRNRLRQRRRCRQGCCKDLASPLYATFATTPTCERSSRKRARRQSGKGASCSGGGEQGAGGERTAAPIVHAANIDYPQACWP